ncbi:MAG: ATP-binding cassette domain-containing protein [Dermatophilaceae bacterium]
MTLTVQARLRARGLDVDLHLGDSECLAVLGPNGAGKSTLLAVLAGILRPDHGRAELDGRPLFHLDGRRRRWVPAHARRVSLLAQDPLLFPNLTVVENVAFGPRAAGAGRSQAHRTAERWLEEVDAAELAGRKPHQLSGGQAQRVALARALAPEPRLLLLDEPLAALDVAAVPLLRRVLRRVLADRGAILVTHDALDAVLLSQRLVVLDHGVVVEAGPTQQVLRHPRTRFTGRMAGLNLVSGLADRNAVRQPGGERVEGVPRIPTSAGEPAVAAFGPEAVSIFTEPPHGSPRNVWSVTVTELEPRGGQVRVRATTAGGTAMSADVTNLAVGELDLYPGKPAYYAVKAAAVSIYPS